MLRKRHPPRTGPENAQQIRPFLLKIFSEKGDGFVQRAPGFVQDECLATGSLIPIVQPHVVDGHADPRRTDDAFHFIATAMAPTGFATLFEIAEGAKCLTMIS